MLKSKGTQNRGRCSYHGAHVPTSDTTEIKFPKLRESSFLENNVVIFKISVTLF